ncbi:uncharacterized protein LOC123475239 isoform X2 [Daphnia magna]|uniref:uncharacterized protein LOC123475239 isoform X2 n=1 Tax=Daphnia magna TaxID=35525 RepID=UPI001E1BA27E|nr:uncharacterized protein LOC123475239 isoform X2 [Daphnia magna]
MSANITILVKVSTSVLLVGFAVYVRREIFRVGFHRHCYSGFNYTMARKTRIQLQVLIIEMKWKKERLRYTINIWFLTDESCVNDRHEGLIGWSIIKKWRRLRVSFML